MGRLSVPTSLEAIAEGNAEASVSEEPGAVIPHAGIRAGGGRATALPTATAPHPIHSKQQPFLLQLLSACEV